MKKIIALVLFAYCLLPTTYAQIKVAKATNQRVIAGMGGVYMNYTIEFADKKITTVKIDSVKSIADASTINFGVSSNDCRPHANKLKTFRKIISFRYALAAPQKCKTCVETTPAQPNLTKGVIIYYKRGEKQAKYKVKKFVELEEVVEP